MAQEAAVGAPKRRAWLRYLKAFGPGLVTGAADDDPSGIATYAQAGSLYGYALTWTLFLCLPLMIAVQLIADRSALTSGKSLGALALERYGRRGRAIVAVMLVALLLANVLNLAADVAAVGAGMNLLHTGPAWVWALTAGLIALVLLVKGSFAFVARIFNALALSLLGYVVVVIISRPDWLEVLKSALPLDLRFDRAYVAMVVAILGTTISPYMLFWQSGQRIEDMREEPMGGDKALPLKRRSWRSAEFKRRSALMDVVTGMVFSQIVAISIMVATAGAAGGGGTTIHTAADAAAALRPAAGRFAEALFALCFIGSGMLAVPVLVGSASIGISGLLHREWGFSRPFREAPFFYWLIIGGTVLGTVLSILPINIVALLVFSAVVNGMLAPGFIILLMLIATDARRVSEWRLSRVVSVGGWLTAGVMSLAASTLLLLLFV